MKRLFSLLLVVAMTAALLACSPAAPAGTTAASTTDGSASSGVFKAGIGISNITPSDSVPMQGYGQEDKHMSNGFAAMYMSTVWLCRTATATPLWSSLRTSVLLAIHNAPHCVIRSIWPQVFPWTTF